MQDEGQKTTDTTVNVGVQTETDAKIQSGTALEAPTNLPVAQKKRHIVFISIIVLLVLLGVGFWIFREQIIGIFVQRTASVENGTSGSVTSALEQQKKTDAELIKFITPTTGETWLETPKAMSPQGWLAVEQLSYFQPVGVGSQYYESAEDQLAKATPTYKEIGTRNGNSIILVDSPTEGMAGMYYLFEKRQDGTVAAIVNPQTDGYAYENILSSLKESVSSKVTVFDETTHYDSLNIPSKIALENGEYALRPDYLSIIDSYGVASGTGVKKTLVAKLGGSSLYRTEFQYVDTGLTNIGYYMQLPIGTKVSLRYEPNQPSLEGYSFNDGASMQYKNGDGKMVYDELLAIARGCGGNSAAVTRSDTLKASDIVQVGKTNTGRAIYELKDTSAALYKKAYDEYAHLYGADAISFSKYLSDHGMVVIKDAKGELLVYVRSQYAPSGGCAKPVVYLYPESTLSVNVRVGADVTVSDPEYTTRGWQNVVAQPSGQLSYSGKTYDSLFWEGKGVGDYPGITSGVVVKRADVAATLRHQLAQQGLNAKETADFMAFWESKIPNKPYVRLTWFNTADMNALAPLFVSPKPDTVIRVFLDMEGFDKPLLLPAQILTAPERKGFTVVEWGGLTSEIRH